MNVLKSSSLNNGVLFIPPVTSPVFTEDFAYPIPVGILSLVSSLRQGGFSADVYLPRGFLYSDGDHDSTAMEICETKTRIVGFSTWCHSYPSTLLLAERIKSINPEIIVLLGGPQASILDNATMEASPNVDYILRGEADFSIVALLKLLAHGASKEQFASISGLTWRNSSNGKSSIVQNPITNYPKDLDTLPLPAYDILPAGRQTYNLDVGRGCPYQCTFCSTNTFFSRDFRTKSPDRIVKEMARLHESNGALQFSFTHDSFTARRSFVQGVCERLKAIRKTEGKEFRWTCSSRIDCVDDTLLEVMADAGCHGIFFGVESGSPRIQKLIKKNIPLGRVPSVVSKSVSLHIEPTVSFIAGFPEETREDIEATLRMVIEVLLLKGNPQISLLSLQPGTELFQKHHESLMCDGYFSDFSGAVYGRQMRERIESDRLLFSSFFLPPDKRD